MNKWDDKNKNRTSAYNSWASMKARCTNPKQKAFKMYGGRGIGFDETWNEYKNFLADMGDRPEGTTLDRIDNTKGYYKENCRWANRSQQAINRLKQANNLLNSKYKGVCKSGKSITTKNAWRAQITFKGEKIHIGRFETQELAAIAYNETAKNLYGEYAVLNEVIEAQDAKQGREVME